MNELLETALYHRENSRPVIAVGKDKRPYREGWNRWFTERQTEEEVREQFSNGAYGLALLTFPGSNLVVLDFDGVHAQEAWQQTGIELPETARNTTPSGGVHLIYYAHGLDAVIKRKVRLVKTSCSCPKSCGVDFLVNGFFVIPPTPNYREDPDFPFDRVSILPGAVLKLVEKQRKDERKREASGEDRRYQQGERKNHLVSLAGSMRNRGMSVEAIRAALETENQARCVPPLEPGEIEDIIKSAEKWEEGTTNSSAQKKKPWVTTMDRVIEEKTSWLWKGRIPTKRPTVFGGDPGTGKSYFSLEVAASVTCGNALPGGEKPRSAHNVLLISTEDGYSDVCKPRLRVLGADMARVYIPEPERNLTPTLIPSALEHLVRASEPKLVILDPLMAFAAGKAVKEASIMRQLLGPMAKLAEKFDFALLIICHLNKSQVKALYRVQESIDLVALARSVFIFANDSTDKDRHIIAHAKSSVGSKTSSLSFYIRDDGNAGRFEWGGTVDVDVDQLLGSDETKKRENTQLERAKKWLHETLANGSLSSNSVKSKAEDAGLAWKTVWRAKEEIGVKPRKARGSGEWFWTLPEQGR